jgi:hypothetical protein
MLENPPLPAPTVTELARICLELKAMLALYRQCHLPAPASVSAIADVLLLHEYVWDAVALLQGDLPTTQRWAVSLTHLYQTRRDAFSGALSLCGLGEMIKFIEHILADNGWHAMGPPDVVTHKLARVGQARPNHAAAHPQDPASPGAANVDAQ